MLTNLQSTLSWSLCLLLLLSCQNTEEYTIEFLPKGIGIEEDRFVDDQGRHIILNGINVVSKSKADGYIFDGGTNFYKKLRNLGINCIRFIIIWDRLEPSPGQYNKAYLQEIDACIEQAGNAGIFVVLDMHQDLFSVKYSDGAPEWATLDEGKQHTTGAIWSDAYMLSEAVQTSFDNFWENRPAPDGIGLQDHYAALWQHIAKRYKDNPTVIGYDLMNEPFPGSSALQSTLTLLQAYGQLHADLTGVQLTEEKLGELWANEEKRMGVLEVLSTKDNYDRVFSTLYPLNSLFETEHLQPMYQKVSHAIRAVDQQSILFLEHSYFSNTGVESSIRRVTLPNGNEDPLVAYAPHGYDLVTDTKAVAAASDERVAYIYNQIKETGSRLNMPIWLGEWGAFYGNSESVVPAAKNAISLIEEHLFGQAYWSYGKGTEDLVYYKNIITRTYPSATNGELLVYRNDMENRTFSMSWQEQGDDLQHTIVYCPRISAIDALTLTGNQSYHIEELPEGDAGYVIIAPEEGSVSRELNIAFKTSK
ncbi:MAG: cellulase family glycosylhydrolase [Saprospiraceae bacterium]|nr:cellulase family glycosylhydrolase [Saprospiraceae bacterium]